MPPVVSEIQYPYASLLDGDLVMSRSGSIWGAGTRAFTRNRFRGEEKSQVDHAGIITQMGISGALVTEALVRPGVIEHSFYEKYIEKEVCVARALNISDPMRIRIAKRARSQIGKEYTERALWWQALGLAKVLAPMFGDHWRICSWLVGYAYEAGELNFGVDYRRADPDDIWDFVVKNLGTIYVWVIPPTWMPPNSWEPGSCLLPSSYKDDYYEKDSLSGRVASALRSRIRSDLP